LLPVPARAGTAQLRPLTFGGALLLDRLQSPLTVGGEATDDDVIVAGYLLTLPYRLAAAEHCDGVLERNAKQWAEDTEQRVSDLEAVVVGLLIEAQQPAADTRFPLPQGVIEEETVSQHGNGLGFVLTATDLLCGDYGWSLDEVLEMPVATAWALIVARRINNGAKWREPNYYERELDFEAIRKQIDGITKPVTT
jgi:hypothetical protein